MRVSFVLFYLLGFALVSSGCQGSHSAAPEESFVVAQQHEQAKRYEEALASYRKAAKRGHVKAQLWLGEYYERGNFPNQDGFVEGPRKRDSRLADWWYHSRSEKWYADAASALRKSADQGDPSALTTLALLYYKGAGVEKNLQEARKLWESAADQQDPFAHYWLGLINRIEKNYTEAFVRFERAAELGHLPAYKRIADMYSSGLGVPQDIVKSVETLYSAVERGGEEEKQHLDDFLAGLRRGAANGNPVSKQYLKELQEKGLLSAPPPANGTF